MAGICIGTMALIIVLSAFNGLSDLVQKLYNSFDADIEITLKQGKTFSPNSVKIQQLKKIEGIAYYVEVMEGNALLKFNDKQCIATIKGVSTEFAKMSGFDSLITEGVYNLDKSNIVIGKGISYVLQNTPADVFSSISIYAPKRGTLSTFDADGGLNEIKAFPSGSFSINDEFDYKYVIMNIFKARELFDYNSEVTSLEFGLKPDANKDKVQEQMISILGEKYEVKNRQQQNSILYKTLKSEKLWTFIILVFILIIATFNVIGSLTMLIIEKKKDITILHNMGADIKLIRRIFLMEGLLITIIGAALGLIFGTFVCWLQIKFSLLRFTEGYVVDAYPIKLELTDFMSVLAVVLLIGFFAAWYPVRVFTKRNLAL